MSFKYYDPSVLPPVASRTETKTFRVKDGNELFVSVEISDSGEQAFAILDKQRELLDKWSAAPPVPGAGESQLKPSGTLCLLIARFLVLQVPSPGQDPATLWNENHWATLSRRDPAAFGEVNRWVTSLLEGDSAEPLPDSPTQASPLA